MKVKWRSVTASALLIAVGSTTAHDAHADFWSNAGNAISRPVQELGKQAAKTEEHLRTDRLPNTERHIRENNGPSIDRGVRHFIDQLDRGMPGGDPKCAENPNSFRCSKNKEANAGRTPSRSVPSRLPPVQLASLSGNKVWVVFQNRTSFQETIEVWDETGGAWVFSQRLAPWEKVRIPLLVDRTGKGWAVIRRDHQPTMETRYTWLRDNDEIS